MEHEALYESFADVPADAVVLSPEMPTDLPASLGTLPDGRDSVIVGDVTGLAELNHRQGDNPYRYEMTCGLVSCEDVLRQFGVEVTEADVVEHAVANQLCTVTDDPAMSGFTTADERVQILHDYGIPAHVEVGQSLKDLAADVEGGRAVIVTANAGWLWDDPTAWRTGSRTTPWS